MLADAGTRPKGAAYIHSLQVVAKSARRGLILIALLPLRKQRPFSRELPAFSYYHPPAYTSTHHCYLTYQTAVVALSFLRMVSEP